MPGGQRPEVYAASDPDEPLIEREDDESPAIEAAYQFTAADVARIGSNTRQRRQVVAYWLATPSAARCTKSALAVALGVSRGTIVADAQRHDVRDFARHTVLAGFGALMLASARAGLVRVAQDAASGDREALAWLLGRLGEVGLTHAVAGSGSRAVEEAAAAEGAREHGGLGVMTDAAEVERLNEALRSCGLPEVRGSAAGGE
ncbi:MAG: hypothetical protein WC700_14495 [Gemmatimonadaceae bacterium]|jgi:hypothetical protein